MFLLDKSENKNMIKNKLSQPRTSVNRGKNILGGMIGCNPSGSVKGLWKCLMSSCKADEYEGFKVFLKGEIRGAEGFVYVFLVQGIKWRRMWMEKIGIYTLVFWVGFAPSNEDSWWGPAKGTASREVSGSLEPDDNVGADLTPPTSHWNLELVYHPQGLPLMGSLEAVPPMELVQVPPTELV